MFLSSSSSNHPSNLLQDLLRDVRSRRLLLHTPLYQPPGTAAPPGTATTGHDSSESYTNGNSLDANVVMILSVLLCALICALGLNSIIRCALRCSRRVNSDPSSNNTANRLANTGIKRKALKTFPTLTYSTGSELPRLDSECVICLSEFAPGDRVRVLPKCNHGFHLRCIDKWLTSHSSCPTCRHCLIETCQKIVGCSQTSSSELPRLPPPALAIPPLARGVLPLQREGLMPSH
ncbi:PREDICTED: RING-H2 finger protein ATL78 [Nelumbo nucifera]|uniref:RING-type domain-containing protein n=2 Tax=Nelumbo nucifera TaxID=4432 RepID=A0A822Z0V7_NELNU|nr:PREDICTED: RING-H2 finger protein ATL78 [Nelumbo nucifera]DAD40024.1 TPA_asm: hypothetical protein HUJ06_014347 [Nelumbo nucifera]